MDNCILHGFRQPELLDLAAFTNISQFLVVLHYLIYQLAPLAGHFNIDCS